MTKASDLKACRRSVSGGAMVAEVRDRVLTLRPSRTRKGGPAEITVSWEAIYYRAMLAQVEAERRIKRHGRVQR